MTCLSLQCHSALPSEYIEYSVTPLHIFLLAYLPGTYGTIYGDDGVDC